MSEILANREGIPFALHAVAGQVVVLPFVVAISAILVVGTAGGISAVTALVASVPLIGIVAVIGAYGYRWIRYRTPVSLEITDRRLVVRWGSGRQGRIARIEMHELGDVDPPRWEWVDRWKASYFGYLPWTVGLRFPTEDPASAPGTKDRFPIFVTRKNAERIRALLDASPPPSLIESDVSRTLSGS